MGKDAIDGVITIVSAIIVVAVIALLVSNNSATSNLISTSGTAFSNVLKAATGSGSTSNTLALPSLTS